MKKGLLLFLFIAFFSGLSSGQSWTKELKKRSHIGGGIAFGTDIVSLGINVLWTYKVQDELRITPNFTYFFPSKTEFFSYDRTQYLWELNIDANYIIPFEHDKVNIYMIGGLNLSRLIKKSESKDPDVTSDEYNYRESKLYYGVNLGVGGEYAFTKKIRGLLEAKYVFSGNDQLVIKAGVAVYVKELFK
ncbi:MAG: outer membrane beta-barrel protein [Bacteroidales bacterium]|nr:outer membrane beta-barrel protein [Bacteroidales bacterium]